MIDEKELQKILKESQIEIRKSVVEEIKNKATQAVGYEMTLQIKTIVQEFVVDEIGTELAKVLLDQKPAILKAVVLAADQISAMLTQSIVEGVKENLGKSWTRDKIIKAILD